MPYSVSHDIAQVPWNGHVAVVPADVRFERAAARARRAHRDDRAPARQLVGLRDEVELAADAAHDAPVREPVGHERATERRHHRGIDEARVAALRTSSIPSPGPSSSFVKLTGIIRNSARSASGMARSAS